MVVCPGIDDVPGAIIGDAHQRVIGRHLRVVAIHGPLRETIELNAGQGIGATGRQ